MNVSRERESWRVMTQPHPHLLRVLVVAEQHRGACIPERLEADPRLGTTKAPSVNPLAEAPSPGPGMTTQGHPLAPDLASLRRGAILRPQADRGQGRPTERDLTIAEWALPSVGRRRRSGLDHRKR